MSRDTSSSQKATPGARIFAIDRRIWQEVCKLGFFEAITYLVIASGTGGDQRTSGWSLTAVETYAGIHPRHGRPALRRLQEGGFISTVEIGKLRRHTLQPPDKIPAIIVSLASGAKKSEPQRVATERALSELKIPVWIWLPNSLIEGAAGEVPPIRLLQDAQSLDALRLFIELYYSQDLVASSGVEWRYGSGIRESYYREKVGQHGVHEIWAFTRNELQTFERTPFWFEGCWPMWDLLLDMGLVEFVTHLVSSDLATAQVLHPLPQPGTGEPAEREIYVAATAAGQKWAPFYVNPKATLVPVLRTKPNVQLVGIARLKYRAQTSRTAEWLSRSEEWQKIAMGFQELTRDRSVGGIKEGSRWGQGSIKEGST